MGLGPSTECLIFGQQGGKESPEPLNFSAYLLTLTYFRQGTGRKLSLPQQGYRQTLLVWAPTHLSSHHLSTTACAPLRWARPTGNPEGHEEVNPPRQPLHRACAPQMDTWECPIFMPFILSHHHFHSCFL